MRIVAGENFTLNRWVVVARVYGDFESIVYDPDNGDAFLDIQDCISWVQDQFGLDSSNEIE